MKFGKADSIRKLDGLDWNLPKTRIDYTPTQSSNLKISTGGTMWTIRPWRGSVYPEKDPMRTWPKYYGEQFGTIEFNATHYKIYSPEKMAEWANSMPEGFEFCPKFPAIISHYRRFNNCEGPTDDFIEGLLAMGEKLGPAFLQLPPHYSPKQSESLIEYLKAWPNELMMSVEFRHPLWFEGDGDAERVWALMSELGIGAVISDTALRRDALHMRLTSPFIIVRFGGYDGHNSDKIRIENWCNWIDENKDSIQSFHFLVHQTNSIHTPQTCIDFARKCMQKLKIKVKSPNLYQDEDLL